MKKEIYDIVIVGGGVIGSSTAYHLMVSEQLKVAADNNDVISFFFHGFNPLK